MNKINLGCGNDIQNPDEYINHDLYKHRKEIDICFDLNNERWPAIIISSKIEFDEVRAWDVIEHIDDPINFMNNCWEILKENGVLDIKACGWQNPNFHVDITHKRAYDVRSFDYFLPETKIGIEYNYYTEKKWKVVEAGKYDRNGNVLIKLTPIK